MTTPPTTPLTDVQRKALQQFRATGEMTHDTRIANALIRRGLVTKLETEVGIGYALTEAGEAAVGKDTKRGGLTCAVDGCTRNVYGDYNLCGPHFDAYLNGRLKRGQG